MKNDERMLNAVIANFREENNIRRDKLAFDYFTISQILKEKDIDFDDVDNSLVDGGLDGGIDSISIFINDKLLNSLEELKDSKEEFDKKTQLDIYVIQNKEQNSFKESVFEKLIPTFRDIFNYDLKENDLCKNYNSSVLEKIILLRQSIDDIMIVSNNVKLHIIYACKGDIKNVSDGVTHKKEILQEVISELISIPYININILGANELRNLYVDRVEDELILKYETQMSFECEEGSNSGYITTVNLKKYFDFVTKDKNVREDILESNIRHFQGNVSVNRGILNTLSDNKEVQFWWLNNGITILVSEIVPLPNNKLRLKDVQVVNGLQTTFCITEYLRENYDSDENRTVLVKIIKTTDCKNIDKIISSTNSQTEVRPADLRATDDLQRDIEEYFLSKGYYYDRRKNYYKNLKKERNKIFNIAKAAQYIETILFKRPHAARSNPTTLLKGNESYTRIFNKSINVDAYLKSCMIYKLVDTMIKDFDKDSDLIYSKFGVSMKHFTFHIMLVVSCLVCKKTSINDDELAQINVENISEENLDNAVRILINSLQDIILDSPTENAISLAKIKVLTDKVILNTKNHLDIE
ncbi:AIPR family protein [Clostridium cagae]|uniref:AIPR family protein n=1 Tax=Clostridium cagae TaxID=2080751 RepID=UPI003F759EFA